MREPQHEPSPLGPRRAASDAQQRNDVRATTSEVETDGDVQRLHLLGERLHAEVVKEQPEFVRVYTELVERTEQLTVTLYEERLVIETRAGNGRVTVNGQTVARGDRIEIPLTREKAVVSTEVVPLEEVVIRTERLQRNERISGTLRREELVVEGPHGTVVSEPGEATIVSA